MKWSGLFEVVVDVGGHALVADFLVDNYLWMEQTQRAPEKEQDVKACKWVGRWVDGWGWGRWGERRHGDRDDGKRRTHFSP